MENKHLEDKLPDQETGAKKDIEKSVEAGDITSAKQLFNEAKNRLIDVNNWDKICGKLSAVFQLTDAEGNVLNTPPKKGDYFKIDLPGPGSVSGSGYDWVQVEMVEEKQEPAKDSEYILIRVRPAEDPTTEQTDVAHFFSDDATSNFVVERRGTKVIAAVYGRNESPNAKADSIVDKVRNSIVAISAMLGMANPQWKSLVNGLLGKD